MKQFISVSLLSLIMIFTVFTVEAEANVPTYVYLVNENTSVHEEMNLKSKQIDSVQKAEILFAQPVSKSWYYVEQKNGYVRSTQLTLQKGDYYVVNSTSNILLRQGATSKSQKVATVIGKSVVIKYGNSNANWVFVKYGDTFGYLPSRFLKLPSVKTQKIEQSEGASIRTIPSRSSKVIGSIPYKSVVQVYSSVAGWSFVTSQHGEGYILTANIVKPINITNGNKKIALTFDDGPNARVTPLILNTLKKYNVKATFFVVGQEAEKNPTLLRRIVKEGHQIGNHSWSHRDLTRLSIAAVSADLSRTNKTVQSATGVTPKLYRPPYGSINVAMRKQITMRPVLWSVDTLDWKHRNPSQTLNYVKKGAKPGGIILMHDIHAPTATALESIIIYLRNQGYTFVTVAQL